MKKRLSFISLLFVLTLIVSACGNKDDKNEVVKKKDGVLSVYTTVYPLQFFTEQIGGEYVDVRSIYPAGSDEHTFDPTQKDMMALSESDLFFYIGLGLEGFVENAQKTLKNEHVEMIATANAIPESKLGENDEHEHDEHAEDEHGDEHGEEAHHDHGEFDPHVWISPTISIELARSIKDSLITKMPEQKDTFEKNFDKLESNLLELNDRFKKMTEQASTKTFFVSHAAFGYIAKEYGLHQVAIAGLNSQNEPSQKQLAKIVEQAKKDDVQYILFEQNVSSKLTEVVRKELGAEALTLHNLGVLTQDDMDNNETYFTLMERNLSVFEKALNSK